jgi:hypothetical protein
VGADNCDLHRSNNVAAKRCVDYHVTQVVDGTKGINAVRSPPGVEAWAGVWRAADVISRILGRFPRDVRLASK